MSLIRVPEHRPEDLQAWEEVSRYDLAHARTEGFVRRVMEAQREIDSWCAEDRDPYVSVSWGKDSVCLAHLAVQHHQRGGRRLPHLRFSCPELDPPRSSLVRDSFLARFSDHLTYEEVELRLSSPPVYGGDGLVLDEWEDDVFCPAWFEAIVRHDYDSYMMGLRADESAGRRKRLKYYGLSTDVASAPISRWTAADVWAYLAVHDLPIHPVYAMSMGGRLDRDWLRVCFQGLTDGAWKGRADWERIYGAQRS